MRSFSRLFRRKLDGMRQRRGRPTCRHRRDPLIVSVCEIRFRNTAGFSVRGCAGATSRLLSASSADTSRLSDTPLPSAARRLTAPARRAIGPKRIALQLSGLRSASVRPLMCQDDLRQPVQNRLIRARPLQSKRLKIAISAVAAFATSSRDFAARSAHPFRLVFRACRKL